MSKKILFSVFIIAIILEINAVTSSELPSLFKACRRSDPNLNDCVLKNAQNGIKIFSKGIPEKGVPASDPALLKRINPMTGGTLNMLVTDCNVYKMGDAKVKSMNVDLKNRKIEGNLLGDIEFDGKYEIDGRLLILPITGKGDIRSVVTNAAIKLIFEYKLVPKNGIDYIKLTKTSLSTTSVDNVHFNLTNLFNGNKLLGENTNNVLNESWREVYDELATPVFLEGSKVIHKILQKLFDGIPYDQIFLPD